MITYQHLLATIVPILIAIIIVGKVAINFGVNLLMEKINNTATKTELSNISDRVIGVESRLEKVETRLINKK
jgi:pantothenate kinase